MSYFQYINCNSARFLVNVYLKTLLRNPFFYFFSRLSFFFRFECLPGVSPPPNETACEALGCCYSIKLDGDMYAPVCYHSVPSSYGYLVNTSTHQNQRSDQHPRSLVRSYPVVHRMGNTKEITVDLKYRSDETPFRTPSWHITAKVQQLGNDAVRILLYSPEHNSILTDNISPESGDDAKQLDVIVREEDDQYFTVIVFRLQTNETVMETVFGPLIYGEKYIEISTWLPTRHLYGLGQKDNYEFSPNFDERERWALFSRDGDDESGPVYGAQPFFMNFEETAGYVHGLYLKNSAPIEVGVLPTPAVVFRALGGLLDLRVLAGPTPHAVSQQYMGQAGLEGTPAMPPYWALGYHLCRTSSDPSEYE